MKILLFLIAIHVSIYDRDLYMSLRLFKTLMGHLPTSITLESRVKWDNCWLIQHVTRTWMVRITICNSCVAFSLQY